MFSLYHLPNQLPDEKVEKVIRRDIFILFKSIVLVVIMLLGAVILAVVTNGGFPGGDEASIFLPIGILAFTGYILFVWVFLFFSFIDYYLDVWIITNERIINIEQHGFFSRTIAEQRLFRIQDVTSEVKGFWPTVLKHGNVYVQTAAEKERFAFEQIPNPDSVRSLIIKLAEIDRVREAQAGKNPGT